MVWPRISFVNINLLLEMADQDGPFQFLPPWYGTTNGTCDQCNAIVTPAEPNFHIDGDNLCAKCFVKHMQTLLNGLHRCYEAQKARADSFQRIIQGHPIPVAGIFNDVVVVNNNHIVHRSGPDAGRECHQGNCGNRWETLADKE